MQPLFISYSRVDSAFALKLVRDLKARGIGAWMDQLDIRPGANWDEEIELALGRANIIVVILSSHSASSENVKNEIGHALELKKQVVPIVAAKGAVPLMITRLQREDFTGDYEAAFNKLVLRLGGAGRTETLAAISHEEVERISAASAERLAAERSAAQAESAGRASGPTAPQDSLNPAIAALPKTSPATGRSRQILGTGLALVVAAGLGVLVTKGLGSASAPSAAPTVTAAEASPSEPPAPPEPALAAAPPTPPVALEGAPPSPPAAGLPSPRSTKPNLSPHPPMPMPPEPTEGPTEEAPAEGPEKPTASIDGTWFGDRLATVSRRGSTLEVSIEGRPRATGSINGLNIFVSFSDHAGCCSGRLSEDGRSIAWSNGSAWHKQ